MIFLMTKKDSFLAFLHIMTIVIATACQRQDFRSYPSASLENAVTIQDLKKTRKTLTTVNVEGYVVFRSHCPACPSGAACMPCPPDIIIVSEKPEALDPYLPRSDINRNVKKHELVISVLNPQQFEIGKKYRFTAKLEEDGSYELAGYDD